MNEDDKQERSFARAPIELKVEYKKLNTFFFDYTRNISRGGTFIKTPRPLEVGTEFLFTLRIPQLQTPLSLKGRVQWTISEEEANSDGARSEPGMGIAFVYETEEEREAVMQVVEGLMVQELGEHAYRSLLGRR